MTQKVTVSVVMHCEIDIPITDSGYLGADASVQEHINKAERDIASWTFLVRRGATEAIPVKMNTTLKGMVITQDEN